MKRSYRLPLFFVLALSIIGMPSLRAGWLQEDIPVCTNTAQQQNPVIASDGQGGAIVAWEDIRNPFPLPYYSNGGRIFIQRHGPDGDPLWPLNGIDLSAPGGRSAGPSIVPDGTGGAFVVFLADSAFCTLGYCDGVFTPYEIARRVIVTRMSANGEILWQKQMNTAIPSGWSSLFTERYPMTRPDGMGGIVVIWEIAEGFSPSFSCPEWSQSCYGTWDPYCLFAQRVDADGNRVWGASPVRICFDPHGQEVYHSAQIESGSIVIAWADSRNGTSDKNIYAQRINLDGALLWGPSGVPVATMAGKQDSPFIASDGLGGAIVIWNNYCNQYYPNNFGIWSQRLDASGQPLWPSEGIPIETSCWLGDRTGIIPDFAGGAIVFWNAGSLSYGTILMAQKLDSLGNALWEIPGKPISESAYKCINPRAIPDGEGGAAFSWERVPKLPDHSEIYGIWGTSANEVFAVGGNGAIFHYDGQSWSRMSTGSTNQYMAVWGSSTDNVFAVGIGGKILHFDGTTWTSMNSGTTNALYGIWGSAPDTVYAVGNKGTILRFDGSTWTNMNYAGTGNLTAVHGRSGTDIYAVGPDLVLHCDGSTWSRLVTGWESSGTGSGATFYSVWASPENLVFVGGKWYFDMFFDGFILRYDGTKWREAIEGIPIPSASWGTDSSNVYVLAQEGQILHYDGSLWTQSQASVGKYCYALWGTAGGDIWIGGSGYCIRHFEDPEWVTQNNLAGSIYMSRIDAAGIALWDVSGAPVSVGINEQTNHYLAPGGDGGALVAWQDNRNGNWNIYARKVSISRGPLVATELMNFTAGLFEAGIKVTWQLSQVDEGAAFEASRAGGAAGTPWTAIAPSISRDGLSFGFVDNAVEAGVQYRYRVQVSDERGSRTLFETEILSTPGLPLTLSQNVPNPFNPTTTIRYYLPERCRVKIAVYDVAGRTIASLADRDQPAGHYSLEWNGRDNLGKPVASGIYFCRLQAGKEMRSRKMIMLR